MPHANSASGCLSALWSSLRPSRLGGLIRLGLLASPFLLLCPTASAQGPASLTAKQPTQVPEQGLATYVLGPGDTITIRALNVEEISEKPVRIGTSGIIK